MAATSRIFLLCDRAVSPGSPSRQLPSAILDPSGEPSQLCRQSKCCRPSAIKKKKQHDHSRRSILTPRVPLTRRTLLALALTLNPNPDWTAAGSKFISAAAHPHADEAEMASTPLGAWSGRVGSPNPSLYDGRRSPTRRNTPTPEGPREGNAVWETRRRQLQGEGSLNRKKMEIQREVGPTPQRTASP